MNNKIQEAFSASAKQYDSFSGLHRQIADKLFLRVVQETAPSALLDVGCGTGYLTGMLKNHFPKAKIIGLDAAPGMLKMALGKHAHIGWVLADGHHLPFIDGCFDVLVSNLAYQWAGDLPGALTQAKRVLAPDGILACTLFGWHTCQELFQSLEEAGSKALQFNRLPHWHQVRQALAVSGFKHPQVDREEMKIEFKGMRELVVWLKSIGANHLGRQGFLGPDALAQAAAIYREKFPYLEGVGATFEVIKVYAKG